MFVVFEEVSFEECNLMISLGVEGPLYKLFFA